MNKPLPVVIVGAGLAGALTALRLAERRPDLPLLLIDEGERIGGNHTWSFFDTDVQEGARDLVAALGPARMARHRVRFAARERVLPLAYNAVESPALDALVRRRLPPAALRLGTRAARIEPGAVVLETGERIAARAVIDARGPDGPMPGLMLGWQKFVGIEFAAAPAEPGVATLMDATLPQIDGFRFAYVIPLAPQRVLVEDTYYSDDAALDEAAIALRVRAIAGRLGIDGPEIRRETGLLPIVIGGDPEAFWPAADPIARIGLRGGFFHPVTGYSFGHALAIAGELAALPGAFDGAALAAWTRARFMRHWRATRFYRLLGRMLFHAAAPERRHQVFAHFYRLPPDTIARFYAGRLSLLDRARILSGRPPVPVGAALAALAGRRRQG